MTTCTQRTSTLLRLEGQHGFSLVEVLVALVILSIGLLGLAGLQTFSLKFNHQSYQRTQATTLIYDIIDRMRANPDGLINGRYNAVPIGNAYGAYSGFGACPAVCPEDELANYDLYSWKKRLQDPGMLTEGAGGITFDGTRFRVTVQWSEEGTVLNQTMDVQLR